MNAIWRVSSAVYGCLRCSKILALIGNVISCSILLALFTDLVVYYSRHDSQIFSYTTLASDSRLSVVMDENGMAAMQSDISDSDMQKPLNEGAYNSNDVGEIQNAVEVSSEVNTALGYSSEKLANLENLLLHVLAGKIDIGAIDVENDDVSAELIEKAFTFDLLYALLSFELREMDNLMVDLQELIVDALRKMSACEHSTELLTGPVSKLHDSEELLKQSQESILEMKIQLAKLQMTSFSSKQYEWENGLVVGVNEELHLASTEGKPEIRAIEQRRILRMLEKSLARELELEKKLTELKQNEEDLKLKKRLTEQVAVCMEEAAEVAWGRFLEADNRAEVLMGISKEMLGKLQIVKLNLSSSTKREHELNHKLQDCINQLNVKETSIEKLNCRVAELVADNAEVTGLREKVRTLEEKLKITESKLEEANACNETSRQQLKETEAEIQSLREKIDAAEGRAESAEQKATHLTDSNLELTEELDFLKNSNESHTKKVSVLEKQLREFDIQLQHSRASSEASQEQQSMLYTAIWDMETLIDELKQKVAVAESKTESAEERCIILSERNSEINKELKFLRSRMEFMEKSLDEATLEKQSCAKDIGIKTSLIMDTVMQLAMERERVRKQLISLTKENKVLRDKLHKEQQNASVILQDSRSCDAKEVLLSALDSADFESGKTSVVKNTEIACSESFQVQESTENALPYENETGSSSSENVEDESETRIYRRTFMSVAVLVLLLSVLAGQLFLKKFAVLKPAES
ncbi:WPP domain-interacting tail-anchored protein 2 [Sesamum alatum]|uniref:WPP domain-interacting tail-anchored protein 2 n=1 Tax=Sesamum alatum TaxID=300844 RepID=A0AAE2CIQ8_9LAMI|nr:WPP domain-interacting tail-anchored protein 2 [Sesamum alatum]